MTATAGAFTATTDGEIRPPLAAVPGAAADVVDHDADGDAVQLDAERSFWRTTIIGMVIGAVVCAGIWALLAVIAIVGRGWPLGPALLMAAAVGVCAGVFYGGCAGVMIGVRKLEAAEHATRASAH